VRQREEARADLLVADPPRLGVECARGELEDLRRVAVLARGLVRVVDREEDLDLISRRSVFDDEPVLGPAEKEPDAGSVIRVAELVVALSQLSGARWSAPNAAPDRQDADDPVLTVVPVVDVIARFREEEAPNADCAPGAVGDPSLGRRHEQPYGSGQLVDEELRCRWAILPPPRVNRLRLL
jgi:hypothetical protein